MSLSVSTKWTPPLTEANLSSSQQQQLEVLLCSFWSIFQPPRELPPKRILDHRIPLKEGTTPIQVEPYRQPYFQRMRSESKSESFYILDSSNLHRALIRHQQYQSNKQMGHGECVQTTILLTKQLSSTNSLYPTLTSSLTNYMVRVISPSWICCQFIIK